MKKTKFVNIETGHIITMWPTTEHTQSSYGLPVWVDKTGYCFGQCDLWPVPFGFTTYVGKTVIVQLSPNVECYGSFKKFCRDKKLVYQSLYNANLMPDIDKPVKISNYTVIRAILK